MTVKKEKESSAKIIADAVDPVKEAPEKLVSGSKPIAKDPASGKGKKELGQVPDQTVVPGPA